MADGPFLYFSLPALDAGLPRVRADLRRTPLYWDAIARQTASVAVLLPPGYAQAVMMPPAHRWSGAGGQTETVAALAPAAGTPTLTVQRATVWQPAVFAPESYVELLETHRLLTHPRTRFVLLRKGE